MHLPSLTIVEQSQLIHPIVKLLPKEECYLAEGQSGRTLRFLELHGRAFLLICLGFRLGRGCLAQALHRALSLKGTIALLL